MINKHAGDDDVEDVETILSRITKAEMAMIRERLRSPKASSSSNGPRPSGFHYDLFAVIMHRGSAHSGHYFAYIKDSLEEGQWGLGGSGRARGQQQLVPPTTGTTQPSMNAPLLESLPLLAQAPSVPLPIMNSDNNSSLFAITGERFTEEGLLPLGLMTDAMDIQPQQSMMVDAATWNGSSGIDLHANNPAHNPFLTQQQQLQWQQQQHLMSYNSFGNQYPMGPDTVGLLPPHINYGAAHDPNASNFGFNNSIEHDHHLLLQQQQQQQYYQQQQQFLNGANVPLQSPFQTPFLDQQQRASLPPPPPGFSPTLTGPPGLSPPPPPPPGLATSGQPMQQMPLSPVQPMGHPYAPFSPDPSLSAQIPSAAPSALSSSMPVTMASPSPQPQTSSSTAVMGLKQMLKISQEKGNNSSIVSPPPPPPPPLVSTNPTEQFPAFRPLFMITNTGVIRVERNSALGVLVDIVGKGCPHRLQGRSFKVLKTTLQDFNTSCFELLESVKGKGKRWVEKPYSYVRGNKDIFSIVGEGVGVEQFIVMVDEPEVELKERHHFANGEVTLKEESGGILTRIKVNEDSELGLLVSVLQDKGEIRCGESWDEMEAKLKAQLSPSVNTFRKPLRVGHKPREFRESRHLTEDIYVGDEFAIHQGNTWANVYEEKYGDIVEFIAGHKKIFTVPERIEGLDGQNATWQETDLELKPNSRVVLRQNVELVDNFETFTQAPQRSPPAPMPAPAPVPVYAPAPSLPIATVVQARQSGDSSSFSVMSPNDAYRLLPRSALLEAKLSEICGFTHYGRAAITLIRESSAVGVLVQCFLTRQHKLYHHGRGGGKSYVLLEDLDAVLMGDSHTSVLHRFPDFPDMNVFISNHQDVFYIDRRRSGTKIQLRNHFNSYCVVNDENYLKICAVVDETVSPLVQNESRRQERSKSDLSNAIEPVPSDENRGSLLSVAVQRGRAGSNLSSTSMSPPLASADQGDRGIRLPASSVLRKKAEEILEKSLRGSKPADDITVYPESCPVGALVKVLKKESRISLNCVSDKMKGPYISAKERFPGFPGTKAFLSKHTHIFVLNVDEEKHQEKKNEAMAKGAREAANIHHDNFSSVLLTNPSYHHVISDEHFMKICAVVDEVNGNHELKQVQGSGLVLDDSQRRVRASSNLSIVRDSLPMTSTDVGDRGITLAALSTLKTRAEEILGVPLQGDSPTDAVTVYPKSCPVGVMVQALKKELRIPFCSAGNHLGGQDKGGYRKPARDCFPGFPGMRAFLSKFSHVFIQYVDEEKYEAKKKPGITSVELRDNCTTILLKNPSCHHVISDEQFTKIRAVVDEENGNHGFKQVQGTSTMQASLSQQSLSQFHPHTTIDLNMAQTGNDQGRRMRSESNLSTTSTDFDAHRGLHLPQPSFAEHVSYHSHSLPGPGYLGPDGSLPDCSNDEAIAQTMSQMGMEATTSFDQISAGVGDDERLGMTMVDPNDAPESWEQAASGKKKGKNKGRGSTEGTAGVGGAVAAGSTGAVMNDARSERLLAREKQLAEELMGMTHGRYFEFNDTTVTPMPLRNLEKSFEGKESAYILVYRKQIDPSSMTYPSATAPPPTFWAEKALAENVSLKLQREQYNAQSHTAIVRFLCPGHLRFKDPLLEMGPPVVSVVPDMSKDWLHFIDMSVDLRHSIDEVKASFLTACRAHVVGLGLLADPLEPGSDNSILSKLVISNLDKYGEGYHPSMPLGSGSNAAERGSVSIGDVISESATLLVWNGKSIGGVNVHAGTR